MPKKYVNIPSHVVKDALGDLSRASLMLVGHWTRALSLSVKLQEELKSIREYRSRGLLEFFLTRCLLTIASIAISFGSRMLLLVIRHTRLDNLQSFPQRTSSPAARPASQVSSKERKL